MLFNSYFFIFGFLPLALVVYFVFSKDKSPIGQMVWLAFWSCVFYAHWKPRFLILLMFSVFVNYMISGLLHKKKSKCTFAIGIVFNILVIAYFKYRGFLIENINLFTSSTISLPKLTLPLGISFITFQKIGYLVDVYRGKVIERNFLRFLVFISYFPQLIAGPIVHYNPLMSQFSKHKPKKLRYENLTIGASLFIIGLGKKVLLADTFASYSDPAFTAAMASMPLTFVESWVCVLSYTFQIYFDFSGYSDMAIGTSRMFGVRLPINFNSPYKSSNIIDFWRRWHITLSVFLRDFVYIPLGGNRKGELRKFINLFSTMLIGGLWHGANWTFVIWGAIHGSLLTINHIWQEIFEVHGWQKLRQNLLYKLLTHSITFISVSVAWLYFRTPNIAATQFIVNGMLGRNGFSAPQDSYLEHINYRALSMLSSISGANFDPIYTPAVLLLFAMLFVWLLPNSQQIIRYRVRWEGLRLLEVFIWKPRAAYLVASLAVFYTCLVFMTDLHFKPFAYFAF